MDIQIPGLDGYETTSRIKTEKSLNTGTPIIGLSASIDESTRRKCKETGMDDFLLKPVKKTRLLSLIAYWTNRKDIAISQSYRSRGSDSPPVLNYRKVLVNFENDRSLYLSALRHFTDLVSSASESFHRLVKEGSLESLFREAHKIKGAASLIGAEEIYAAALELEKAVRSRPAGDLDRAIDDFKTAAGEFIAESETVQQEVKT